MDKIQKKSRVRDSTVVDEITNQVADLLFRKKTGVDKLLPASADQHINSAILQIYTAVMFFFSFSAKTIKEKMPVFLQKLTTLNLNENESLHLLALQALYNIDFLAALKLYIDIVTKYPQDKVAILMLETCGFLSGHIELLSGPYAKLLDIHGSDPDFLGNVAFLYCHLNRREDAKAMVIKGLNSDRHNAWLQHVYAHTLHEDNIKEVYEGIEYLESRVDDWPKYNHYFEGHNWTHLCMLHLKSNINPDIALEAYPKHIWGQAKEFNFEQNNAFLALWYSECAGYKKIPTQWWEELASYASKYVDDYFTPYLTVTSILTVAKSNKKNAAAAVQKLENYIATLPVGSAKCVVWSTIALPALKGCLAFIEGNYPDALLLLEPIHQNTRLMGHSDEQRGIFAATIARSKELTGGSF